MGVFTTCDGQYDVIVNSCIVVYFLFISFHVVIVSGISFFFNNQSIEIDF